MEDQSGGYIEIRQCHTVKELGKGSFGSVTLGMITALSYFFFLCD